VRIAKSIEKSRRVADNSTYPIDKEHRAVMERTIGASPTFERLLDHHR
jgi:hypothetical protein